MGSQAAIYEVIFECLRCQAPGRPCPFSPHQAENAPACLGRLLAEPARPSTCLRPAFAPAPSRFLPQQLTLRTAPAATGRSADYFPQLEECAVRLIKAGHMYADDTPVEQMRQVGLP